MHVGKTSARLPSVYPRQLCLLVATIQLICHTVKSNEFALTHPNTHPAQRDTTSTLQLDEWQDATTAGERAVGNYSNGLNSTASNLPKTKLTSEMSASVRGHGGMNIYISVEKATKADIAETGPVSTATIGSGVTSSVGRQVPGHVTHLSTYLLPTSPGHGAKNTTYDGGEMGSTQSGNGSRNFPSSSHGVPSNSDVTTPLTVTSATGNDGSERRRGSTVELSRGATTHVESGGEAMGRTTHGDIGSTHQLMTSANETSADRELVDLVDRGQSIWGTQVCRKLE